MKNVNKVGPSGWFFLLLATLCIVLALAARAEEAQTNNLMDVQLREAVDHIHFEFWSAGKDFARPLHTIDFKPGPDLSLTVEELSEKILMVLPPGSYDMKVTHRDRDNQALVRGDAFVTRDIKGQVRLSPINMMQVSTYEFTVIFEKGSVKNLPVIVKMDEAQWPVPWVGVNTPETQFDGLRIILPINYSGGATLLVVGSDGTQHHLPLNVNVINAQREPLKLMKLPGPKAPGEENPEHPLKETPERAGNVKAV